MQNYPQGATSLQHTTRWLPNGDVSVFDNQSQGPGPAQAVEFALDLGAGTATPVFQFGSPEGKQSFATGDFRRYADGHSVVDWGFTAFGGPVLMLFSEIDAAGNDVLDVGFGTGDASYRTVKAPTTALRHQHAAGERRHALTGAEFEPTTRPGSAEGFTPKREP